jgi:hypothetical protein
MEDLSCIQPVTLNKESGVGIVRILTINYNIFPEKRVAGSRKAKPSIINQEEFWLQGKVWVKLL